MFVPPSLSIIDTFNMDTISASELSGALALKVLDKDGNGHTLGSLVRGKRVVVLFIRWFGACSPNDQPAWCTRRWASLARADRAGCGSCHAYLRHFDSHLPPSKLSPLISGELSPDYGTLIAVIVVGHGDPASIKAHQEITATPWPVYTDPTRSIHKVLKFNSDASVPEKGTGRDYRRLLGSKWDLMKLSLRVWFFRYPAMWNKGGDGFQNGGELILDASESRATWVGSRTRLLVDGEMLYFHRMMNSMDHTDANDIARVLGVPPAEGTGLETAACGTEACERPL